MKVTGMCNITAIDIKPGHLKQFLKDNELVTEYIENNNDFEIECDLEGYFHKEERITRIFPGTPSFIEDVEVIYMFKVDGLIKKSYIYDKLTKVAVNKIESEFVSDINQELREEEMEQKRKRFKRHSMRLA